MRNKFIGRVEPSFAYALGIFVLAVVLIGVTWIVRGPLMDWVSRSNNGWAVVFGLFAIALLPWRVVRYFRHTSDDRVSENGRKSKPADRDEPGSSS